MQKEPLVGEPIDLTEFGSPEPVMRKPFNAEPEPLVCCVCLTRDRPEMLKRAIACFQAQTYRRKFICAYDTSPGAQPIRDNIASPTGAFEGSILHFPDNAGKSIGWLRNEIALHHCEATIAPDIFIHWDDDDWSHPERIAEQVALLKASGKEAVGFREMLFWRFVDCKCASGTCSPRDSGHWGRMLRTAHHPTCPRSSDGTGDEAWLYISGKPSYCLGTSLCYWRTVWERRPFEDVQTGEDYAWLKGVDSLGVFALRPAEKPRMIASIHGGNTSPVYKREYLEGSEAQRGEWKRVPQWDDYCRRTMEGEYEKQSA